MNRPHVGLEAMVLCNPVKYHITDELAAFGEVCRLSLTQQTNFSDRDLAFSLDTASPTVAETVLAALAYADLFDYPLTLQELVKYQVGTAFSTERLIDALHSRPLCTSVSCVGDNYCLRGREAIISTRLQRAQASQTVWGRATLYSHVIARLPFVRMVAVTGALAVNNISKRPDIDLLIAAEPGRVWICRRFLIVLVRLARILDDDLCPNYVIASSNLDLQQRDFFTAHELAQMVPLYGAKVYSDMLRANSWASYYLPSGFAPPVRRPHPIRSNPIQSAAETLLRPHAFDRLERWEMRRLRSKLRPAFGDAAEVICSPIQCKGHTSLHRRSVTARYAKLLHDLGLHTAFSKLLDRGNADADA